MHPIEKIPFGKTGHNSTRTLFGSVSLNGVSREDADRTLELLFQYGINHIDTAPRYGNAELQLGPWMKKHRDQFFLATKTDKRSYGDAKEQFYRSLDRLQVDSVDLLQLHNLTDVVAREIIMGPGGAIELLVEAKDAGLTRFIGITGHGILAPRMHLETLERFQFDTILLPCNFVMMQNPFYADAFNRLLSFCSKQEIAVQTIKSIAKGLWGGHPRTHKTWYEPLVDDAAITQAVHYVLGIPGIFLNTVGDINLLPKVFSAAAGFESQPQANEMVRSIQAQGVKPLFDQV